MTASHISAISEGYVDGSSDSAWSGDERIQAVVRREQVSRLLKGDSPRHLAWANGLGAASSSCSYAAVALAPSLFRKGASLSTAMAFEIASTNLVIELGIILWLLMGWQFTLAEFIGGPIMIVLVALGFRFWMRGRIVEAAREQADRGVAGAMEGHAAMNMSVQREGTMWQRLFSPEGFTSVAHDGTTSGMAQIVASTMMSTWDAIDTLDTSSADAATPRTRPR